VGLAARRRLGADVVGWDPDPEVRRRAVLHGAVDAALDDPAEGAGSDLWVVAAPVRALQDTVALARRHAGDAIVTDVGSVKRDVVRTQDAPTFLGGHPLAGAEAGGVGHAREDLFDGATWYLTPGPSTEGVVFERVHQILTGIGALPVTIDAEAHDRLMAAVSHLPHVIANVLVAQATQALGGDVLPHTGPSFRDATRVAGANPPLWGQIYAANAAALGELIDDAIARLSDVRGRLADLEGWQAEAAAQRRALLEVGLRGGPESELRVSVPNRPGVVADLALTLGRAGINISDMSLAPAPDQSSGVVALWVAADEAARARELIAGRGLAVL
jgi:prephenate dehydrogenase